MKSASAKLVNPIGNNDQPQDRLFKMPFSMLEELHEIHAVSWAIHQLTIISGGPNGSTSTTDFISHIGSLGSTIQKKSDTILTRAEGDHDH